MNRCPFIVACSSLADAAARLPADSLHDLNTGQWMLTLPFGELLLHPLGRLTLDGIAGQWHLLLVMPHNCSAGDFRAIGPKAQRLLQRARIAASTKFKGPWSIPQFAALFPVAAQEVPSLYDEDDNLQSPLVFLGDEPRVCGAVDYRPTDQEAAEDTPTDLDELFGGE